MNITITENCRFNNDQTIKTPVGSFLVEQRNAGFIDNDRYWIVNQIPELYWSATGELRQRRPGKFLGAFATSNEARAAILAAGPQTVANVVLS